MERGAVIVAVRAVVMVERVPLERMEVKSFESTGERMERGKSCIIPSGGGTW